MLCYDFSQFYYSTELKKEKKKTMDTHYVTFLSLAKDYLVILI